MEMENWEQIANQYFKAEFDAYKKKISGGRRPDAVEFTNIEGDVSRRDLTINALFYDIDTFEIVDLVGGIADLKNGIVRTVGAAEDRLGEDPLRIQRAIRFAEEEGRALDPALDAALTKNASLEGVSGERIRDEFLKGLKKAHSTSHFLQTYDKYKLFDWVFKGLSVDKKFINDKDPIIVIADMLKSNNIDTLGKILNNLKYSAEEVKAIRFLVAMLKLNIDTAVTLKRAQEHAGVTPEQIKNFCKREGVASDLFNAFIKFNLSVSGPEIMDKTGIKPGPELGKAINQAETDNFKKLLIHG